MPDVASAPQRILHLGVGAFHRAHQAVYMQRLLDAGDAQWSLVGANIRPDDAATLRSVSDHGWYTLETVTPQGVRSYERIASIASVVPWDSELAGLVRLGAEPSTRIISFTVTEAGYAPVSGPAGKYTLYGALSAILRKRMESGAGPVTLLCCDNLRHNGARSRAGLLQFIESAGDTSLLAWTQAHTSSPSTMVDRITPRPTPEVAQRVKEALGVDDPAALMAESFLQWVIEDDFIAGRPAWERVGAELVRSVAPYEEAKIRLLNATHSCIAWAGTLAGFRYIHEGSQDPEIRRFGFDYATNDAIPVLSPSPIDLQAYRDVVLERFGNAVILDTNERVAADSFAKIPAFIAPTVRDRLARGESIASVAMLPALFLACLRRWHAGTLAFAYQDQAMDPAKAHAICAADDPVAALCAHTGLWGELAGNAALLDAVRRASARVGAFETARRGS